MRLTRISQDTASAVMMWRLGTLVLALCALLDCGVEAATIRQDSAGCAARGNPVYSVVFKGEWTKAQFPKQYPRRRPPAQWSTLVGRVHNGAHTMWSKGQLATPGVRLFAEEGKTVWILNEGKFIDDVASQFLAAAVGRGVGSTAANITVNGKNPMVSFMVRLVPSPDWFTGVSSLNLCEDGRWKDEVHVDLDPWDAGTDGGLTFSSPSFAEKRQHRISMITSKFPNHPASSFYYRRRPRLPRIGEAVFIKLTPDPTTPEPTTLPPTTTTTMATTTLPPTTTTLPPTTTTLPPTTTTLSPTTTTLPPTTTTLPPTTTTMATTTLPPTTTTERTTPDITTTPEVTTLELTTPDLTTAEATTTTQMTTIVETTELRVETTWGPTTTLEPLTTAAPITTTTPEDEYYPMVVDVGVDMRTWEAETKEEETTKHTIPSELTKEDLIPTKKDDQDPKYAFISSAEEQAEDRHRHRTGFDADTGSGLTPQADGQRDAAPDNRPIPLPVRLPSGHPSADKKGDFHVGSKGKENVPKFSSLEEELYPPFILKSGDGALGGDKVERSDMPVNCAVSAWSPWGQCSTTCGLGIKRATRWVTQAPENGGEPCPALLREGICINDPCPGVEMCLFDCNSRYNYRFIPYKRKFGQEP
ncbi:SPON2 [Branchiostoma lanceolatum]|uniref:SPON2 protein n=1 Tax=Branchiostoma lanceolatum TaxID=7740 RepID=A0A8K0EQY2_BRALA|nr:SPON2 [Branchiostoma lanceolatum]